MPARRSATASPKARRCSGGAKCWTAGGGIEALGAEIAEDAASTKLDHRAGLRAHLVDRPFQQPLGGAPMRDVWGRQVRWARLRRATFPLYFAPETAHVEPVHAHRRRLRGARSWALHRRRRSLLAALSGTAPRPARPDRRLAADVANAPAWITRDVHAALASPRPGQAAHRLARQCDERRRNHVQRSRVRAATADLSCRETLAGGSGACQPKFCSTHAL